ncbi:MAG: GDP-mannose 4,6-dehydratase [Planctomycetota bacterium]|jgi:UDP-glucose 4-epimerase
MHVLITGGAGFIGSHLAEKYLAAGGRVTVIDDLSTGSLDNIAAIQSNPQFEFVCDSVRNESTMALLVEKCDCVFHLAAAVGVQLIVDEPVHTIETNIHGTEVVLSVANKFRKKVLIASVGRQQVPQKSPHCLDQRGLWQKRGDSL